MTSTVAAVRTRDTVLVRVLWIASFAILTGVAALIRIPLPFTPVPITLQTGVVLASGIVLGRDGLYSQLVYLVLGGIGLPMFAGSLPGFPALFGPTGGYLLGFVGAAALASSFVRPNWKSLSYKARLLRLSLISLVVFVPGVLQLALFAGLTLPQAAMLGFVPFVLGDILKVLLVAGLPGRALR
jgi:biotin transport system substrate-specific component